MANDQPQKKPDLDLPRLTTIKELGMKLPIGNFNADKNQLSKDFELRPYKAWVDRNINLWQEEHEDEHIAKLVVKYISLVLARIGQESFGLTAERDSTPEQEMRVSKLYYADVVYMYIMSRIKAVGPEMDMPYVCGRCGKTGIATADLWSLEVRVLDSPKQLERWLTLQSGAELRDGTIAKKLKLRPIAYRAQLMSGASQSAARAGYNEFREAVCGVDTKTGHYTLTDDELDNFDKIDMLALDRQAAVSSAGPDLRTHLTCPHSKCGAPIREAFDWTFNTFFDSSVPLRILVN